jgi:hypothetical protein
MVPIWLAALADMLGPTAQTQSEIFNLFLVHKTLSEIVNLLLGLQSVSVQAGRHSTSIYANMAQYIHRM